METLFLVSDKSHTIQPYVIITSELPAPPTP